MKMNKILLLTACFGMFLSSCGGGGSSAAPKTKQYTITFKDEEDHLLESKKWDEGSTPSYNYVKQDSAEWDYTVEGWSTSLGGEVTGVSAVSEDATYWAVVNKVKQQYVVTFYDENGDLLDSDSYPYGAQPSYDYAGPSDTAEWDYTFQGWATSPNGSVLANIPTVTGVANYYAIVQKTKQYYDIQFCENDGYILLATSLPYGATPSYNYETSSSMEWEYTFLGWAIEPNGNPLVSLPTVTGNAIYYAQVSKTKKQYTITFDSNGGSSVASITEDYGTVIQEPDKPKLEGYHFSGWTINQAGGTAVSWPITLTDNMTLVANWNEKIDIKGYLATLFDALNADPNDYIPQTMGADHSVVIYNEADYDYSSFNNLSHYYGFGEQWHMVLENITESERFYAVTTLCETVLSASVVIFNNWLDENPGDTANHSIQKTDYTASINFSNGKLTYSLRYTTGLTIPFFGTFVPQVDMELDVSSLQKTVRIQITENNAMKYIVNDSHYQFALEYGVETVSRKAYFEVENEDDEITGHIYEFVQYKDKDLVPSCADFYINDTYTSVVGNKASGIIGFSDYINELYTTSNGKMLGYEIMETKTLAGKTVTFNTLWFNLTDIDGLSNIKYVDSDHATNETPEGFYVNNSTSKFENKLVGGLSAKMASRRYDIENRKRYIYSKEDDKLIDHEVETPMMFVQVEQLSTFTADVNSKNSYLNLSINLSQTYLTKIQDDYGSLIEVFIQNKGNINSDYIVSFIGSAAII